VLYLCGKVQIFVKSGLGYAFIRDFGHIILDRMIHNFLRIELKGESLRKKNAEIRNQNKKEITTP